MPSILTNSYFYSSIFRVFLALHIFKRLFFIYLNKDLLVRFISQENPDYFLSYYIGLNTNLFNSILFIDCIFIVTFMLCACFAFGLLKNITPILLFLCVEVIQRNLGLLLNGGDNYLKFALLYMCFINSYMHLTLFASSRSHKNEVFLLLHKLGVLSIKLHLCLIYFITGIFKVNSKIWFSGVATYYTLNLNRFDGTGHNNILSKNGYFITIGTYFTMLWELTFPFLIWLKKIRPYILTFGVVLHIAIYLLMMIHEFEVLFIMTYGFFINDATWNKIRVIFKKYILALNVFKTIFTKG